MTHPVDIHVGARIRLRRKHLNISQERLADSIGITFQQVQKYERGGNRISASKLFGVAKALHVPVTYFFADFAEDKNLSGATQISDSEAAVARFLLSSEGIELARAFPAIGKSRHRRKILDLIKSLADDG